MTADFFGCRDLRRMAGIATGLALSLSACSLTVSGTAVPLEVGVSHSVEWVSDPEGNPEVPLSVTLRGDGQFLVNADFPPGLYETSGQRPRVPCIWRKSGKTAAGAERIVESGGGSERQVVSVESRDSTFQTEGCMPWRMVLR